MKDGIIMPIIFLKGRVCFMWRVVVCTRTRAALVQGRGPKSTISLDGTTKMQSTLPVPPTAGYLVMQSIRVSRFLRAHDKVTLFKYA